jgi:LmbE family N-acetylglucosaminyl deacetylase
MQQAHELLGIRESIVGDFPNIAFNTVPHVELVRFMEEAVRKTQATRLITHHPEDLNVDHRYTSQACQAAARLFQRTDGVPPLESLLFMEVLSSTDWAFAPSRESFRPQAFYSLGEDLVTRKLEALACFEGVMRDFPHPRSAKIIRGLAAVRGGQAGVKYAEAFQVGFARI